MPPAFSKPLKITIMTTIEIRDKRDKDLLTECVLNGIRDLVRLGDASEGWGCGTLTIQDAVTRLKRILGDITETE